MKDKEVSSDTPPKVLRLPLDIVNMQGIEQSWRSQSHHVNLPVHHNPGYFGLVGKVVQVAGDWMPQSQLLPPVPVL